MVVEEIEMAVLIPIETNVQYITQTLRHDITKTITGQNMKALKKLLQKNMLPSDYMYPPISYVKFNVPSVIRELVNVICESFKNIKLPGCEFIEEYFRIIEHHFEIGIINCAAWLVDPKFMADLLIYPAVSVDSKYQNLTPLNILANNLNAENFDDTFECIKLLVDYGANPNLPDDKNKTPISNLLDKNELDIKKILIYFLDHTDIELDDTTEPYFKREFPNRQIPNKSLTLFTSSALLEEFGTSYSNVQNDEFLTQFNKLNNSYEQTNNLKTYEHLLELLILTIRYKLHKAFDAIIATGLNINFRCRGYTPIKTACYFGNWKALKKLLKDKNLKLRKTDKLLITVVLRIKKATDDELSDYYSCFHTLLDSNKISINETDYKSYSVLHYAVFVNKSKIIREVLERGAYMGAKNIFDELAINRISPVILEQCFDSCITANESVAQNEEDEANAIIINYINFIPPKIEEFSIFPCTTEMDVLEYISETKALCHLLKHPLIMNFVNMKWENAPKYFLWNPTIFVNLLLIFEYVLLFKILIHNLPIPVWIDNFIFSFWSLGLLLLVTREFIQFIISPRNYVRDFTNYLEIFLIILLIFNLFASNFNIETQKALVTLTTVLIVLETYFLYSFDTFASMHMLMFRTVSKSFFKSLLVFGFLIVAFGNCFFILFEQENFVKISENVFYQLLYIKPIVMMLGEINAANIKFHSLFNYIFFLVFLFFITIVLYNLLNGLAVGDIEAVRNEAELYELVNKIKVLSKYCTIFKKNTYSIHENIKPSRISQIFFNNYFQNLLRRFRRFSLNNFILFKDGVVGCKFKIKIGSKTILIIRTGTAVDDSFKSNFIYYEEIFEYIIKSAINILDKNQQNLMIENKSLELKNQFQKIYGKFMLIEERTDSMEGNLKVHLKNIEDNLEARLKLIEEGNKLIEENLKDRLKKIEKGNKLMEENLEVRLKLIEEGNNKIFKFIEENLATTKNRKSF